MTFKPIFVHGAGSFHATYLTESDDPHQPVVTVVGRHGDAAATHRLFAERFAAAWNAFDGTPTASISTRMPDLESQVHAQMRRIEYLQAVMMLAELDAHEPDKWRGEVRRALGIPMKDRAQWADHARKMAVATIRDYNRDREKSSGRSEESVV